MKGRIGLILLLIVYGPPVVLSGVVGFYVGVSLATLGFRFLDWILSLIIKDYAHEFRTDGRAGGKPQKIPDCVMGCIGFIVYPTAILGVGIPLYIWFAPLWHGWMIALFGL